MISATVAPTDTNSALVDGICSLIVALAGWVVGVVGGAVGLMGVDGRAARSRRSWASALAISQPLRMLFFTCTN